MHILQIDMHALLLPKTTEHRPRNKSFRSNNRKACMIRLYKLLSFRVCPDEGAHRIGHSHGIDPKDELIQLQ